MMLMFKAAAFSAVICVMALCLKKEQPGFAFLLSLCGAAALAGQAMRQLAPLLEQIQTLAGQTQSDAFAVLLRVLIICFTARFSAELCREAGLGAAAFCMEFVGRTLAALQALPLLQELLQSYLSFLS